MAERKPLFTGSRERRAEPQLPAPLDPQLRETGQYVPSDALIAAVEVALMLGQPLLLTGEPGTGKTTLAASVAHELFQDRFLEMQVKSSSSREDLLYSMDEMGRFRDAQPNRTSQRLLEYLSLRPLGEAIVRACDPETPLLHRSGQELTGEEPFLDEVFGPQRRRGVPQVQDLLPQTKRWERGERWVVLIDEIDKAPRDTPNDLLEELERMAFAIPELNLRVRPPKGAPRPVVIVTSNSEKSLPDAFLRRCAYHHIAFPSQTELRRIVASRLGNLQMQEPRLIELLALFEVFRTSAQRPPGTAELLHWLRAAADDTSIAGARNRSGMQAPLKRLVAVLAKQEPDIARMGSVIDTWVGT